MSALAERVAAGAAFLDEREPGWDERIDLDRLDLRAPCKCVLGQLSTDRANDGWGAVLAKFGLRRTWGTGPHPTDAELGFNTGPHEDFSGQDEEYEALDAEWKRVIAERRAGVIA